jgi:WD40 repeat protein
VHDREVTAVAYGRDGTLATAAVDGAVRLWDPTGRETGRLRHDDMVNALAFSRDGRYLATASSDRTARVWDLAGRREMVRFAHPTTVNAIAFSPDMRLVAPRPRHAAVGRDAPRWSI